jgi:hypothetical protein
VSAAPGFLADVIYAHGKAVDEGLITRCEAIEHLTKHYRLTALGAVDVLNTWRTIHARYGATP